MTEQFIPPVMTTIRPATLDDTLMLTAIFEATWQDTPANTDFIAAAIVEPDHDTQVAVVDGQVAGFAAGFMTLASNGQRRWEVDLLAVHPEFRGQRLAPTLIRASLAAGVAHGAAISRALIAVGNLASERSFAGCGFVQGEASELWIASGSDYLIDPSTNAAPSPLPPLTADEYLLPVVTFTYRGVWLEPKFTAVGLHHARHILTRYGWETAGAVIPMTQPQVTAQAAAAAYTRIGAYYFWHKLLSDADKGL